MACHILKSHPLILTSARPTVTSAPHPSPHPPKWAQRVRWCSRSTRRQPKLSSLPPHPSHIGKWEWVSNMRSPALLLCYDPGHMPIVRRITNRDRDLQIRRASTEGSASRNFRVTHARLMFISTCLCDRVPDAPHIWAPFAAAQPPCKTLK